MEGRGLFPNIPTMDIEHIVIEEVAHYGAGNMVTICSNTTKDDYKKYLVQLEQAGLSQYVVNEEGVAGTVFSATYTLGQWTVTVTHMERTRKTYISTCFNSPLSEHLFYKREYVADNKKDASTKLHMLEMWNFGNSFILQLKNGHFIVSDGGTKPELPYLLDYLESLTPKGEVPVIEAWFISHAHVDHCGVMGAFFDNATYRERVLVEGIYYNEPNEEIAGGGNKIIQSWIGGAAGVLTTSRGTNPHVYRPQTGQRYYFCDITIDIVHAQEQLLTKNYCGGINDSSTWCMFTIEGQKVLFTGDGDEGGMKAIMEHYPKEYLDVDIMTLMHHGFNTQNAFTDFCKVKSLLVTTKHDLPVRKADENTYLKSQVEEYYDWADGTKILIFPYTHGSYQSLPNFDWIYNEGELSGGQPNVYVYPSAFRDKEIHYFRQVRDNGFTKQAEYLMNRIGEKMPIRYQQDGMLFVISIDVSMKESNTYHIYFDKFSGWNIVGSDEEGLLKGIDNFIGGAKWTEMGFTPCEILV